MAHGMTITVQRDGKPDLIVFASARKCPELRQAIGAVTKAHKKVRQLQRKAMMLRTRAEALAAAHGGLLDGNDPFTDEDAFAELVSKVEVADAEQEKAEDDLTKALDDENNAVYDFYLTGLMGNGNMAKEQAEEMVTLLDPTDYYTIRERCLAGCGVMDFTKRDSN